MAEGAPPRGRTGGLIGASSFIGLAVATAIVLYGEGSGTVLATVAGEPMEFPVVRSVCANCNRTGHRFPAHHSG